MPADLKFRRKCAAVANGRANSETMISVLYHGTTDPFLGQPRQFAMRGIRTYPYFTGPAREYAKQILPEDMDAVQSGTERQGLCAETLQLANREELWISNMRLHPRT